MFDFIGLIAAAAAGAAQVRIFLSLYVASLNHGIQPLMALLFGRLTQDFVNFQIVLGRAQAGDADASSKIPQAAANFRHGASMNALYLVVLGS